MTDPPRKKKERRPHHGSTLLNKTDNGNAEKDNTDIGRAQESDRAGLAKSALSSAASRPVCIVALATIAAKDRSVTEWFIADRYPASPKVWGEYYRVPSLSPIELVVVVTDANGTVGIGELEALQAARKHTPFCPVFAYAKIGKRLLGRPPGCLPFRVTGCVVYRGCDGFPVGHLQLDVPGRTDRLLHYARARAKELDQVRFAGGA